MARRILASLRAFIDDRSAARHRRVRGAILVALGLVAVSLPFVWIQAMPPLVGALLLVEGAIEGTAALQAANRQKRRSASVAAVLSLTAAVVALALPSLLLSAAVVIFAIVIAIDGGQRLAGGVRDVGKPGWSASIGVGAAMLLLAAAVVAEWPFRGATAIGLAVGVRLIASGWALVVAPDEGVEPIEAVVGIAPQHAYGRAVWEWVTAQEDRRRPVDRGWMALLLGIFFAIHVGRMQADWSVVGLLSPFGAAAGDAIAAVLVGLALAFPLRSGLRRLVDPLERRAWSRAESWGPEGPRTRGDRLRGEWLAHRTRIRVRLAKAAATPRGAIEYGLRAGLPVVAVVIATHPIWGFSWYFNSENWVTAIWERITELRVDTWRGAMVAAIKEASPAESNPFAIAPEGTDGDFSFIVIGDTGEGDSSQLVLKDRYLELSRRDDLRFLVVSSDVIYPAGEMKDYEPNFFLPFKGFTKPIYAIPGNHDWYDALDGFAAVFFEPQAALAALEARRDSDHGLTSTTAARARQLVAEAERLRQAYGVRAGGQRAPFFELQTGQFALLAIDTGILKTLDASEWEWLGSAVERSRGKFLFALVGHPLYAGGSLQATDGDFAKLRAALASGGARIVMGGDTHDLEFYREPASPEGPETLHVVNGGGGAYLSIGTALAPPAAPSVADWGCYPSRDAVVQKLGAQTPAWKWPIWRWTERCAAWPSTPETLSAAFDFNGAPFFQSFVEVRVEASRRRVVLVPHGVAGPLRWRDLDRFGAIQPAGALDEDEVAIVVPW